MLKVSSAGAVRGDAADDRRDDTDDLRLGIVRAMLWTAIGLIMLIRLLSSWMEHLPWSAACVAMLPYAPMAGLLLGPRTQRARGALLVALVALYAAPFALVGGRWDWLPWPLAVAALCMFRSRVGWPLFGLILIVTYAAGLRSGDGALTAFNRTYKTANDGLIVFGIYALVAMATQLHATRGEQARVHLQNERRRFHGELQASVGTQLGVLEQQLTQAVDAGPATTRGHLDAAVDTAREALAGIRQAAGDYRRAPAAPLAPIQTPHVARLTLGAVYGCESAILVVLALSDFHTPWELLLMVPIMAAGAAVLLLMRPSRRQMILLALVLGPTAIPLGYVYWDLANLVCLWPFLLGLVLTRMRRPLSWIIVGASMVPYVSVLFYPPPVPNLAGMAADMVSQIILTWLSYSLIRLSALVTVLHQARRDLARETVARERTRMARDLHDVLSFSLTAVALRGEMCRQLLESDPARARAELATMPELAARAQTELESVVRRSTVLRTGEETIAARAVLDTAGVRSAITVDVDPLPASVDAAVAAVLREAVTNIVRHSDARTCTIAITAADDLIRLRVVNDGVAAIPAQPAGSERGASGLVGVAERTDGRMTAGPLPDGRFELVAEFATGPAIASGEPMTVAVGEA